MYVHPFQTKVVEALAGAKAYHLAKMKAQGFPIPDGMVVTKQAFEDFFLKDSLLTEDFKTQLQTQLSSIGADKYMVRSSAIGEDAADSSFAGQLDSFISGSTVEEVIGNIYKCWSSYKKDNVALYEQQKGKKLAGMAVVVQELVEPDYAGVIFTRSHLYEDQMLVEYVQGHGEQLVSGAVTPDSFHVDGAAKLPETPIPFDFSEGVRVARALEQYYGLPLDIEWVMKGGLFQVVQARPITTKTKASDIYWSNTNVNENYPEAISPLLYSIARDAYYHYFKNLSSLFQVPAEEIRALEPAYANVIGIHGCHMYYNMSSIHEILSVSPFADALTQSFDNFVGYTGAKASQRPQATLVRKLKFIKDVLALNLSLATKVKAFENMADSYSIQAQEAITVAALRKSFYGFLEIRMHSWYRASLADFFAMVYHGLLGKFCKVFYAEEATAVHNKLIQAIPNLISSKPIVATYKIMKKIRSITEVYVKFKSLDAEGFWDWLRTSEHAELAQMIDGYLHDWGYRCSGELMLTVQNYCEVPAKYIALLQQYEQMPDVNPERLIAEKLEERQKIIKQFEKKILAKHWWMLPIALLEIGLCRTLVRLASAGISARERVRLKQALLYFRFKQTVQKVGALFYKEGLLHAPEDAFFLRHQELGELLGSSHMLSGYVAEEVRARKEAFSKESSLIYPDDFWSMLGSYPNPEAVTPAADAEVALGQGLQGLSACGGKIRGRAKVLDSVLEASKLQQGDILVTRQTDPGWVVVFPLISGLIVERGGMLSHGAIVSREFGIPAVVGVPQATRLIKDGDLLFLNADKGEITIMEG